MLVIVERGACSPEGVEERGEGLRGCQERPANTWECVRVPVRSPLCVRPTPCGRAFTTPKGELMAENRL